MIKKRAKVKPIRIKFTKVNAKNTQRAGHFCGRLYHIGDHELERIQGGQTKFFDKQGKPIEEKWQLSKPGKKKC